MTSIGVSQIETTDGQIDYSQYTLTELREAEASIDPQSYPENYKNLLAAIRALSPKNEVRFEEPKRLSGPFVIRSNGYRWFLWVVLICVLASDFLAVVGMYMGSSTQSFPRTILAAVGICLKLSILAVLVVRKGPLELLVYFWGGLFIVSGALGLLAIVASGEPTPTYQYLNKLVFLLLGLGLVAPVDRSVQRPEASA